MGNTVRMAGYRELLIGAGSRRDKLISPPDRPATWQALTTLDINPMHQPDVVWDLTELPLPFEDDSFDEIHAYEVLEHTGSQGDFRFFFGQFSEFWRILKPRGLFCATVPAVGSKWVWGDPSHTRTLTAENLLFLDQTEYTKQVGHSPMSDFRWIYKADFHTALTTVREESLGFILQAIKPSRIGAEAHS